MSVTIDGSTGVSGVDGSAGTPALRGSDSDTGISFGANTIIGSTGGAERFRVDSSGQVGIGTTSPTELLSLSQDVTTEANLLSLTGTSLADGEKIFATFKRGAVNLARVGAEVGGAGTTGQLIFETASSSTSTERARIDSSGHLLVGTSTSVSQSGVVGLLQVEATSTNEAAIKVRNNQNASSGPFVALTKSRGTTIGSNTIVQNGDDLGTIIWFGADGTDADSYAARITCEVDGTPGANDMPGRLVFSTTADGASTVTERMRITSAGGVLIGTTSTATASEGVKLNGEFTGSVNATVDGGRVLVINRLTNDGNLVEFYQATTLEGAISVSGTTVTYGGGHLARWSQLPNNEDPSEILKGTVMSNLDEMCDWGKEENEQLNKTKISDVEGDKNVAGVFVSTSFDAEGPLDFFVAMTGDMVIRIAAGVVVERGDLLMSAGDGTAKPQDDDIIRSKTIAKVTSTNVSCTYGDGSYCVPCVLMAC